MTPGEWNIPVSPALEPFMSVPVVKPLIKANGEAHVFEDLEKEGSLPILLSVGMAKTSPNSNTYVSYLIRSQGDKVLSVEVSEPNLKAIALDEAKVSFVHEFMNEDGIL